ncbi:21817_t:CDS:2, partial [Racocetra persica]
DISNQDFIKSCVVEVCKEEVASGWRKITDHELSKAEANRTLASYYVDHKDEYMCLSYSAMQFSKKAKIANIIKTMNTFKEVFITKQNDTNSNKERLLLLTTKTKVFLLQIFEKVYKNFRKNKIVQTAKRDHQFHLAVLNIMANKKQMLLESSSDCILARDKCDYCSTLLNISSLNPIVLVYSHEYHEAYFNIIFSQKCSYCQSFLEK